MNIKAENEYEKRCHTHISTHRAEYNQKQSSQPPSMTSLIHWNIERVRKINPGLDLKKALRSASEKLGSESYDASSIEPSDAEGRHLACAVLAWRELGHTDVTALYRLVTTAKCKQDPGNIHVKIGLNNEGTNGGEYTRKYLDSPDGSFYSDVESFNSHPLDTLPVDTKLVMHISESNRDPEKPSKQTKQKSKKDLEKKIEAACCPDKSCATRLAEFDSAVEGLRARAAQLARRDAERAELLERAETAWRDLEIGYQRRLQALQEKEDDLNRQIKDLVEERSGYKRACTPIAEFLKERGDTIEQECQRLNATEKELRECACKRHLLAEEATRADNVLGEQHCRSVQQDRDLQFKEEQLRRKAASLRSTLELQRALALEARRSARTELISLREQGQTISDEVLRLETKNTELQNHCNELKSLIDSLTNDLEERKNRCDLGMQKNVDELRNKSKHLTELKQKVIECRCVAPADAEAQVVRTASFAALCRCEPGGDDDDTCSCTSLRTKLLTDVLEGLFSGLHEEMAACATTMPCTLLKCLEDSHNWDRASIIRTRVSDYFSKLLSGELDIAIENCIERYRAKWVGAMCKTGSKLNGEQRDTMLYNVHEVTTQFATQIFPNNLEIPEKEYLKDNFEPRTLKASISTATFAVQYPSQPAVEGTAVSSPDRIATLAGASAHWRRTHQNVTQLRVEIEDLKKEAIKKEDLKVMQHQLTNIMRKASNIVRLTSNNVQDNLLGRKTCDTTHKPIVKSKEVSPLQVENKKIVSGRIPPTREDKKEVTLKNIKKANEIVMPQKKITNKVENSSKIISKCLITKTIRDAQATKTFSKNKYPQGFLFGRETKSTWMDIMSNSITNQNEKYHAEKFAPGEVLKQKINTGKLQSPCIDDYASDQFPETPSTRAFDRLIEKLTKWTNAKTNSNATNNNNQQNLNKNVELDVSLTPIKEKDFDQRINKEYIEEENRNNNTFIAYVKKWEKRNVSQISKQESLQILPFNKPNAQLPSISVKHPINPSQSIKPNNCSYDLLSANNVQNCFHTYTKADVLSPNKSEHHYSECNVNYMNFPDNFGEKLQKTKSVTNLVSNLSKELTSCISSSKTYTIIDNIRNILLAAVTDEKKNAIQTKAKLNITEQKEDHENNLYSKNSKSLKTTFMKKSDLYESQSCVCCSYEHSDEVLKEQNACTFQEHLFGNCSHINNDEISKLTFNSLKKTGHHVSENDKNDCYKHHEGNNSAIDWEKVYLLLYRYITTKIKRLQCTSETKPSVDLIDNSNVSNLLYKLCSMFENDLKKIKNLPKCYNETTQSRKRSSTKRNGQSFLPTKIEVKPLSNSCKEIRSFEIPVNNNKTSKATNEELVTLTTSCQVSDIIKKKNKSCLTVEKKYSQLKLTHDDNIVLSDDCTKLYVSRACSPTTSDRQCSCNILKGNFSNKKNKEMPTTIKDSWNNNVQKNKQYNVKKSVSAIKSDLTAYRYHSPICKEKRFITTMYADLDIEKLTNVRPNPQRITKSNAINDNQDAINDVRSPFTLPNFGRTVECTCDKSLGSYVHTKGILTNKRNEIKKLWNVSMENKQNKSDDFNLCLADERRVTVNSKLPRKTSGMISHDVRNACHRSGACEITSMNNVFILSAAISKANVFLKNENTNNNVRSKRSSLRNEMRTSLSESRCCQHNLLPNINLGRHSTNSSLPVGKSIISEICFWSQILPEELTK